MEQRDNKKEEIDNKKYDKVSIGIVTILLSPILGSFLFYVYVNIVGRMISTDSAVEMFWFSCIFAVAILGIATVMVGCNEKMIKHKI